MRVIVLINILILLVELMDPTTAFVRVGVTQVSSKKSAVIKLTVLQNESTVIVGTESASNAGLSCAPICHYSTGIVLFSIQAFEKIEIKSRNRFISIYEIFPGRLERPPAIG